MEIDLLINHPYGTLSFHQQHLCCYSPPKGVFIVNNVCIVDPSIKIVNCIFTGCLNKLFYVNGVLTKRQITYDTVVFLSKITLKLSSFYNQNIKSVYFINDVEEIIVDIDIDKSTFPSIGIGGYKETTIYKFCKDNGFDYRFVFGCQSI